MITKRPALVLIVGVLGLGIIAIPTLSLYLGLPDDGTAAPDTTKREAYDLISQSFGPGINGPLLITVAVDDPTTWLEALPARPRRRCRPTTRTSCSAVPGAVSADGTFGFVTVVPKSGPSDEATQELVHNLRDQAPALGTTVGGDHRRHRADRGRDRRLRQARRRAAGLPADRRRAGTGAAVADLPVDRRPGGRRARLPADHRRLVRRRGRGLPVGLAERRSSGWTPRRRSSASCRSC